MKIIVKDNKEKNIVRKFLAFLNEYDLVSDYMPDMEGNGFESTLEYEEFEILAQGLKKCVIQVNSAEPSF